MLDTAGALRKFEEVFNAAWCVADIAQRAAGLECLPDEEINATPLRRNGPVKSGVNILFWKN